MTNSASRLARFTPTIGLVLIFLSSAAAADMASPNDIARYLAGLAPSASSPLARLTNEASWIRHARTLDKAWERLERRQLSRIRVWSKAHVPGHRKQMLYMFSGPDFLYADAFYPRADTYVLCGLEPVAPVPDVTRLSRGGRARALSELRESMRTVLSYSFFITKEMKSDLRTGRMRGTVPLLYVFLARAGKTIHSVKLVGLNDDGTVTSLAKAGRRASKGVKIVFSQGGRKRQTLYYFQTDLSNGGLRKSGFRKFSASLGPADSLVKSASYLLHSGNFSLARKFLLKQSAVLIQDDSGVPVRYLKGNEWTLHPFGQYLGPISLFANRYQREMKSLFSRSRAKPIDFGIGYRWRPRRSNVLLAIKTSRPATQ